MDTIQISIKLNKNRIEEITHRQLQEIGKYISGIKSSYGFYYCKCLEISVEGNIIVKISYPKFYQGVNAFLISNNTECLLVQHEFCLEIHDHELLCDAEILLSRVDIPFTFFIGQNYNFNSYRKVYQVFNYIYKKKNQNASPKAFMDIEEFKAETLIYADMHSIASYNSKIMIYDQYKNLKSKTKSEEHFCKIEAKYEDLSRRMRIEVSKRIKRKTFILSEFTQFDIFTEYARKYKEYILNNILDLNEVENFYNEHAVVLAERLLLYRENANYFNYENFIYREINKIYDYEIIRRALKICITKIKTRENAITAIRRVLFNYQLNENIIVMETKANIKIIRDAIENSFEDSQDMKNKNRLEGNTEVSYNMEDKLVF